MGTLVLGFLLSKKLENWFGLGGLRRAQDVLSLQESSNTLGAQVNAVQELRQKIEAIVGQPMPDLLGGTETVLRNNGREAAALFAAAVDKNARQPSLEVLAENSRRFKDRVAFTDAFLQKTQLAIDLYESNGELLAWVAGRLDAGTPTDAAMRIFHSRNLPQSA
jgi:hypothetical protein